MRKWVIAGIVLLFVGAIVALSILNLNSLINRNKDYLVNQAEQALGRKVSVGEVAVSLRNGIGVRLNDFSLSDDTSFSSGDFIRARDLQLNLKLLPLLTKEIQIKRLILHDPVIGIIRDKKGNFNFSSIGKKGKEKERAAAKEDREPSKKKVAPLPLLVSLVDISGGDVHYLDRKEGVDLRIKQIDLRVKDLDFDKPFSVNLAAALFSERQNLKVQTRVGPLHPEADFSEVPLEGEINVDPIDFGKLKSAVPKIKTMLPKGLDLTGILRIKDTQLKGTLKKLELKGALEGTDATINFGKTFKKASGIPLVFSIDAQYANNTVSFRQVKVQLQGLELAGKGNVRLGKAPSLNLSVNSNQFSLKGWEKIVPLVQNYQLSGNARIQTSVKGKLVKGSVPRIKGALVLSGVNVKPPQFPKALKDLSAKINFTGQKANLKETTLSLGKSRIRLEAEIKRFSPLNVSYKLSTPEIWPADFQAALPQERKADVIKDLNSIGQLSGKNGNLNYQGEITSGQGTLYNIGYKNLGVGLVLKNKVANIRAFRVKALNGSLRAQGTYSYGKRVPSFSLDSKVRGLDLKELYSSLDPKAQQDIQGSLNAELKVSGSGKDWKDVEPRLRGQGKAEVLEGALLNFNLAEGAISGMTGIPGLTSLITPQVQEKYPETFLSKDTKFKELTGLFSIGESRIKVQDLRITAADYTVQGNGRVNFDRDVDFRSLMIFSERLSDDLAHAAREVRYIYNEKNQLEIPFALTGRLPNVRPKPDSNYLAKLIQRGMVSKGAEELSKRIFGDKKSSSPEDSETKDPVEDLIRKGLEGLFGR
ncbi:MAG: AsmA family protein [Candidatus Binatia bacterium]